MKRRQRMSRGHSKGNFRSGAMRVHPFNMPRLVMRGGIRM